MRTRSLRPIGVSTVPLNQLSAIADNTFGSVEEEHFSDSLNSFYDEVEMVLPSLPD